MKTLKLTIQQLQQSKCEDKGKAGDHYFEEASTLGLAPGEWPDVVEVTTEHQVISLMIVHIDDIDGETNFVVYDDYNNGLVLTVYND